MASEERNRLDCSPRRLSTVDFLWQIVTLVGAGEVRSGVGTLASPMGAGAKRQGDKTQGDPRVPTLESTPGDAPLTTRKERRDDC